MSNKKGNYTVSSGPVSSKPDFSQGVKHDQEKTDYTFISYLALEQVNQVLTFGAKKYEAHNWRKGFKWTRVASASLRHIFAWLSGQDKDPETGLSHLAHAACCLFFLLEFETTKKELDDRYKEPPC
jgi:hypothetical protein